MEVSQVRKRLRTAIDRARERAQQRRAATAEAERDYAAFLENIATPVTRQVQNALKVEGFAFTVFTPGGGLRLASDRGRDDYVEFALDTEATPPQVLGRVVRTRGSQTLESERPIQEGATPATLTEEDVLDFLLDVLAPWLEK
ncbi:MAG: hypothetical protein AB7P99_07345 [Vicinamibacterales bacterium]